MQLRYALIASVLGMGLIIVLFLYHRHPFLIPVLIDFRIFLFGIFIYVSLKEYRDTVNEGLLFFWQGIVGSYVLILEYAVMVCIGIIILGLVNHNFVTDFITQFTEQARSYPPDAVEQIGKEAFEKYLTELKSVTIFAMARQYFGQCLIIGAFVSIILSVILRRTPKVN